VLQDRCESFQKAARAVLYLEILDVVSHWQALPLHDICLLERGEGLLTFLGRQRLHTPSRPLLSNSSANLI
jgi:hypothetical protein